MNTTSYPPDCLVDQASGQPYTYSAELANLTGIEYRVPPAPSSGVFVVARTYGEYTNK